MSMGMVFDSVYAVYLDYDLRLILLVGKSTCRRTSRRGWVRGDYMSNSGQQRSDLNR